MITTTTELASPIGKQGVYDIGTDLDFQVRIVDTRQRYGQTDYLIEPVAGQGRKWVAHHKVKVA